MRQRVSQQTLKDTIRFFNLAALSISVYFNLEHSAGLDSVSTEGNTDYRGEKKKLNCGSSKKVVS